MYSFDFDAGTGILREKTSGYWSVSIAQRYCAELAQQIAEARRVAGSLRLLKDFSEMGVQRPEVLAEIESSHRLMDFRPADSVAICAPLGFNRTNSERSVAAKQSESIARVGFFSSVGAGRAWLLDHHASRAA